MPRVRGAVDLDDFTRGRIIGQHDRGASQREISKFLNIPLATVNRVIVQFKQSGKQSAEARPGRPGPSERTTRALAREVLKEPTKSVREVAISAELSKRTVQRYLHSLGLYKRVAKKKPLLTSFQKKRRHKWAQEMMKKDVNYWNSVIFSDESRYCQFSDSGRVWVWRRSASQLDAQYLKQTVKFGGVSVMVWGAIWYGGRSQLVFCDGHINANKYIGILTEGLLPVFHESGLTKQNFIFMEDGAPCHRAQVTMRWKEAQGLRLLPWPGQSPDMNPIENVWHIIQQNMAKRPRKPVNKNELIQAVREEWTNLPQETINSLIATMPNRIRAVLQSKGGATKY